MTLIAGFVKNGCPILVGDLLLSSCDERDTEIVFPTIGKISNEHLSCGYERPVSFCQKINLLSPKMAVAWTGNKRYAEDFMRELIAANIHNNPSRDSLERVFNRVGGQGNISVIGMYRDGKEICFFDFNVQPDLPRKSGHKEELVLSKIVLAGTQLVVNRTRRRS